MSTHGQLAGDLRPSNTAATYYSEIHHTLVDLSDRIYELEIRLNKGQVGYRTASKVKVTPWRLLNTFLVLGLGLYKSALAYLGQDTAPTALEWIVGVLWVVIAYWLSFLEDADLGPRGRFLFSEDVSGALLPGLLSCIGAWVIALVIRGFVEFVNLPSTPDSPLARIQHILQLSSGVLLYLAVCAFVFVCIKCHDTGGRMSHRR
ncbi:hypothetical protein R3P38DRAFT_2842037 [Favolaschia claudopus]|uniref:Uncharacterized protein n=1 Tax=Favolaschia claudopus TaxID=2862362 RepID=A0AAW0DZG7_9AGAR